MTEENILEELEAIFRAVLKMPDLNLKKDTTAGDVTAWDSINHAILMVRVQTHFQIKFSISEIMRLKNIANLIDLIQSKQ